MRRQLFFLCSLLSVFYYLLTAVPVFAQDASAPFDGATSPAGRRDQMMERREDRKAEIQARRSEKQKQIIDRMKQKLAAVIDRLNNVAARLKDHVARIRARAAELAANRGADTAAVESALSEAEKHIGLAETEIANVKSQLSELDATDKPKDAAQTFRTGVQSVHAHFKETRTNLVAALKAMREAAKESRPTRPAE